MCHNKETSMIIFLFSIAVFIHLLIEYNKTHDNKYIFAAFYILLISGMQLVEFFIHSGYKSASMWVLYILVLQFIGTEVYLYYNKILPVEACVVDVLFYASLFYLFYNVYNKRIVNSNYCDHPYLTLGCKLNWGILDNLKNASLFLYTLMLTIYLVYVFLCTYEIFTLPIFIIFILIFFMTLIMPDILDRSINFKGSSSAWCFFAVLLMTSVIALDENNVLK